MALEQLVNYYPKYEDLDYVLSATGKNDLNIFVDFKGCAQSIYQEWAVQYILCQSRGCRQADCSLFYSLLHFISWHRLYAKKRNININFYIFLESGDSAYHKNVHKEYKANRKLNNLYDLDFASNELYHKILRKNYQVIEKVVNKIPNCYVTYLRYTEADFIPWYVYNYVKPEIQDQCNIMYTMDKDMLQCLKYDNFFQYYKHYKKKMMLSKNNALNHFLKDEKIDSNKYIEYFPLILSILGDDSDDFKGIKGIGPKTIIKILPELSENINFSMDYMYDCIEKNQPIFLNCNRTNNKYLNMVYDNEEVIIRNLKLSSFELLSKYLNTDYHTEVFEKKKQIYQIINENQENKIDKWNVLFYALNNMSMESINISETVIQGLF